MPHATDWRNPRHEMLAQSPSSLVELAVDDSYLPEVWSWFGLGVIIVILRYIVRFRTVGIRNFCGDDYLMLLALTFWSIDGVIVEITYYTGSTINVSPDVVWLLSGTDLEIVQRGTKWEYASFFTYSGLIWTLKFAILIFYRRLKADEWRQTWLTTNRLILINAVAYLALVLTALFSCWPIQLNWAVRPLPPLRCTFRPQNFWTLVVLNVVTDVLILSLPVPILWQLRVSGLRKLGVTVLLCSGIFMIATAVVRAAFTISGSPSIIKINIWGFRETAAGLLAVNAPVLVPLFRKSFWRRGPYRPGGDMFNDDGDQREAHRHRAAAVRKRRKNRSVFEIPSALAWTKPRGSTISRDTNVTARTKSTSRTTTTTNTTTTKVTTTESETSRGISDYRAISVPTIPQQPHNDRGSDWDLSIQILPAGDRP